jgi:NADPH:quinone reductase-like Zn-dependent oxidoreductase
MPKPSQPEKATGDKSFPNLMNAARLHAKGGIGQLFYELAPVPILQEGEVLVQVMATGITKTELSWDETYKNADGSPRLPSIPGHELAGIVARLGPGKTDWLLGDKVYALTPFNRDGTLAQYVAVKGDYLAPMPESLDFIKCAAAPLAGLTAWQALFTHGGLVPGRKVLIHGAAGGVGTYAVQMAKWAGAIVVATASTANIGFLEQLGADQVIDYTSASFDNTVQQVDVVIDTVGGKTRDQSWQVLKKGGILVSITSPISTGTPPPADRRGVFFIVEPSRKDLASLTGLIKKGTVTPFVEKTFPLTEVKLAFEFSNKGHSRGKTVVVVGGEAP